MKIEKLFKAPSCRKEIERQNFQKHSPVALRRQKRQNIETRYKEDKHFSILPVLEEQQKDRIKSELPVSQSKEKRQNIKPVNSEPNQRKKIEY